MSYSAEISRANPTCFVFLVDHSTSMVDPVMGTPGNPRKAEFVADALNKVIQSLIVSASKDMDIRRYYQIGVLGYGSVVQTILTGSLAGQELVWVDDLYQNPLRIDERLKKEPDGVGGYIEVKTKFPVWVTPVASGSTPMCAALEKAYEILNIWTQEHPFSYPPTVINLTDGESNDGDVRKPAEALKGLATADGNVVLLTVHASSNQFSQQVFFPSSEEILPDRASKVMFEMSSELTPRMRETAQELLHVNLEEGAKGIVYNADIAGIVQALEIGTRPANLR
jgi:uncharacterized protein YegL